MWNGLGSRSRFSYRALYIFLLYVKMVLLTIRTSLGSCGNCLRFYRVLEMMIEGVTWKCPFDHQAVISRPLYIDVDSDGCKPEDVEIDYHRFQPHSNFCS